MPCFLFTSDFVSFIGKNIGSAPARSEGREVERTVRPGEQVIAY